jgi:hypothetical protein
MSLDTSRRGCEASSGPLSHRLRARAGPDLELVRGIPITDYSEGRVNLIDFGVAHVIENPTLTNTGGLGLRGHRNDPVRLFRLHELVILENDPYNQDLRGSSSALDFPSGRVPSAPIA